LVRKCSGVCFSVVISVWALLRGDVRWTTIFFKAVRVVAAAVPAEKALSFPRIVENFLT